LLSLESKADIGRILRQSGARSWLDRSGAAFGNSMLAVPVEEVCV
jgi:hypothetical protein